MPVRSRVVQLLAVSTIAGAVLAGCGTGPSQAGSAVIVGQASVSLADVQSRFDAAIANKSVLAGYTSADQIPRDIISAAVAHELVRRAAAEQGIAVSDAQVDAAIAADDRTTDDNQPAMAAIESPLTMNDPDPAARREAVRDDLLLVEIGKRDVDRLVVAIQVAEAASESDAEAKAQVGLVGGPGAAAVFTDAPQAAPASAIVPQLSQQLSSVTWSLFGTPQGSVLIVPPPSGASTWSVVKIVQRSDDAAALGAPASADQLDQVTLRRFGLQMLQPLAMRTDIRVNPRYGVWDPLVMAVSPPGQASGTVLSPPAG